MGCHVLLAVVGHCLMQDINMRAKPAVKPFSADFCKIGVAGPALSGALQAANEALDALEQHFHGYRGQQQAHQPVHSGQAAGAEQACDAS